MKRLYFLLSIIVMFSLNIFSSEVVLSKRKLSSGALTGSNKKRKLVESNSILTQGESSQFAKDLEGDFQKYLKDQYKKYEEQGFFVPGGRRTQQEKENAEGLIDMLILLGLYHDGKLVEQEPKESQIKVKHKEEKFSIVLYDTNS